MTSLEKLKSAMAKRMERPREAALRKEVWPQLRSRFIGLGNYRWVLIVFALAAFYYVALASNRYVATADIYVKSTTGGGGDALSSLGLLTGVSGTQQEANLLTTFILSQDMLNKLDARLKLRDHYSSSDWDFISRLDDDATTEEYLTYYRDRVAVLIHPESGVISVSVQGFDRDTALETLTAVIAEADAFINEVGHQIARAEITFVEGEMTRAQERLEKAREEMIAFQSVNKLLSPVDTGMALQEIVNQLNTELIKLQAEERTYAAYLHEGAPQLVSIRTQIVALEDQIEAEKAKLTSGGDGALNELASEFQGKQMELKLATDIYQATLVGYEKARVEAYRKLKHLIVVQAPSRPDEALYPRKIYDLTTLFILLSLAYGIIMMTIATIREHRDV